MQKDQVFLVACLGYLSGIFVGSFFVVWGWLFPLLLAVWAAFCFAFPQKNMFLSVFPLALFLCGIFSAEDALNRFREENTHTGTVSGIARVVNDPEERDSYRRTLIRMESCDSLPCPQEKILWQAPLMSEIVSGAGLSFSCVLEAPENFDERFDYRMFLAKDNIKYICPQETYAEVLAEDVRARLTRLFFIPKRVLESALANSLPQPEAGLAAGLLLGGDHRLPETLKQSFIRAGLSHIVAISGYNIALIAQTFFIAGIGMGLWRRSALWLAAAGIILFILLVGAPASAIRAGIMALAIFSAFFFGRLSQSVNMLMAAAVLMLFFQPLLLRYDAGFQLSFLATLAIILSFPMVSHFIRGEFFGKGFLEIAFLTLSVELFIVPLLLYQFHIFSPFALLANVILLPLVPYAMAGGFVAGVSFVIVPGLHLLPAAVAYVCLRSITFIAEWISLWPGASLDLTISIPTMLFWYACLFFVIVRVKRAMRKKYVRAENT